MCVCICMHLCVRAHVCVCTCMCACAMHDIKALKLITLWGHASLSLPLIRLSTLTQMATLLSPGRRKLKCPGSRISYSLTGLLLWPSMERLLPRETGPQSSDGSQNIPNDSPGMILSETIPASVPRCLFIAIGTQLPITAFGL